MLVIFFLNCIICIIFQKHIKKRGILRYIHINVIVLLCIKMYISKKEKMQKRKKIFVCYKISALLIYLAVYKKFFSGNKRAQNLKLFHKKYIHFFVFTRSTSFLNKGIFLKEKK